MGIFDFWKNKTTKETNDQASAKKTETTKPHTPNNHISKKKKNTYIITFNVMGDGTLFSLCKSTPLPVVEINGIQQNTSSGFINCKHFPNPCATNIISSHDILQEIMGPRMSATIIEYLDKDTGTPVVQVYPEGWYVFDKYESDYMKHLNHASRRDFKHQMAIREQKINDYIANQKQR